MADMMAVHLDDRALFLTRWRALLLETLTAAEGAGRLTDTRAEVRRVVDRHVERPGLDRFCGVPPRA